MRNCLFVSFFICTTPLVANAQWEENNWQSTNLAKQGILRMVTRKTTLPHSSKESERVLITETFFDSLGRTLWSVNDACSNCGTVQEFDSLTGLIYYIRTTWKNGFRESFLEYDAKKRRIASESCSDGDDDDCVFYSYEYDDDDTQRIYKSVHRRLIKRDTAKRFLRIYSEREEKKQLVQENFFNPEGQLEETKEYGDGKFQYSLFYEYNEKEGRTKTWHFDGKIKQLYNGAERNEIGQIKAWRTYKPSTGDPLHLLSEPSIQTYEYDANGLVTKTTSKRIITEYEYFTE